MPATTMAQRVMPRSNIVAPNPLDPQGQGPIRSPGFTGRPTVNLTNLQQKLSQANTLADKDKLAPDAEDLLDFDAVYAQQAAAIADAANDIGRLQVTDDVVFQQFMVEQVLGDSLDRQTNVLHQKIENLLKKFDDNEDDFRDDFMDAIDCDDETDARAILVSRLKAEQDKLKQQEKTGNDLLASIAAVAEYAQREAAATNVRRMASKDKGVLVEAGGNPLKLPKGTSFKPDNSRFNLLKAFWKGDFSGTIFFIDEKGKCTFNPKDPGCRKAAIELARAKGKDSIAVFKLGTGVNENYQQFGEMTPDSCRPLREAAMEFMCCIEYGFDSVPPKTMTAESVREYFDEHGKIPPGLEGAYERAGIEQPSVEIKNFSIRPKEQQQIDEWGKIRDELYKIKIEANENLSPDQKSSLLEALDRRNATSSTPNTP